ncbi:MAG: GNAT family N-acetyltransferase [Lachnospiraceae bacterium]|nr:GNAT family N-acetyltransferase [Lachnospiraceae bacterium]
MSEYCVGSVKDTTVIDTEEILDFANMVFSMSSGSIDFRRTLPKAYLAERAMIPTHHMIKEEGRIKALIDVYPGKLCLGQESLSYGYIGTVSVHPRARSKGYMIELMKNAEDQLRRDGADFVLLDGNRHRYQHYGFEKAGMKYCFNITKDSIRHYVNSQSQECGQKDKIYFEFVDSVEHDAVEVMYELYQKRNVTARHDKEEFYLCLCGWEANTYAVMLDDECIGYFNTTAEDDSVYEFALKDISQLPMVIWAFMQEMEPQELGINVGMDEVEAITILDSCSDYYTLNMSHQMKILNYESVLRFLLMWKQRAEGSLADGCFVIGVKDIQTNYFIKVSDGKIEVEETSEKADVVYSGLELVRTLTTSYYFHEVRRAESPLRNAPTGWFPLPFYLPVTDAF